MTLKMEPIYLDHAATTPLHPQVLEAMLPIFQDHYGNPSSLHSYGRSARHHMNDARDRIAMLLRCEPNELVFTSGGTESNNMAIIGAMRAQSGKGHIITTQVEHQAVLETCKTLARQGHDVTFLPVDQFGQVCINDVRHAIRPDTHLMTIIYGNNEVGTLQQIQQIGHIARDNGILFHVDAVQALGKLPIDLSKLPVDLMSFSAHKINGPKGMGLLYIADHTLLTPILSGGLQERKRRAGTENLAGIVGFAKALELALERMNRNEQHCNHLRIKMLETLKEQGLDEHQFVVNGHPIHRLPHILNMSFPAVETSTMLMNLDIEGIAASSGSACQSGSIEMSHVIQAMQLERHVAQSAIRFSFGHETSEEDVVHAARVVASIVKRLS